MDNGILEKAIEWQYVIFLTGWPLPNGPSGSLNESLHLAFSITKLIAIFAVVHFLGESIRRNLTLPNLVVKVCQVSILALFLLPAAALDIVIRLHTSVPAALIDTQSGMNAVTESGGSIPLYAVLIAYFSGGTYALLTSS